MNNLVQKACNPTRMVSRKKILLGSGVVAVLALLAIPAYQPLKFHYAIWRIESAVTPAHERAACVLASRVGHVWEVNEIHPGEFRVLPSRVKPGTNDVITEIEWWESPWWKSIGPPNRACRVPPTPKRRQLRPSNVN